MSPKLLNELNVVYRANFDPSSGKRQVKAGDRLLALLSTGYTFDVTVTKVKDGFMYYLVEDAFQDSVVCSGGFLTSAEKEHMNINSSRFYFIDDEEKEKDEEKTYILIGRKFGVIATGNMEHVLKAAKSHLNGIDDLMLVDSDDVKKLTLNVQVVD